MKSKPNPNYYSHFLMIFRYRVVTQKVLLILLSLLLSACAAKISPVPGDQAAKLLENLKVKDNVLMKLKVTEVLTSRSSASILRDMGLKGHCSLPQHKAGNHVHSDMSQSTQLEAIQKIILENCPFTTQLVAKDGKYQGQNLIFDCTSVKYAVDGYVLDENINRNIPLSIKKGDTFFFKS